MYGCILGSFFSASQVGKGYSQNGAHGTRPHKQKEPEDNQAHQEGVLRWALMHYLLRQYSTSFEDCQVAVLLLYTGVDKL